MKCSCRADPDSFRARIESLIVRLADERIADGWFATRREAFPVLFNDPVVADLWTLTGWPTSVLAFDAAVESMRRDFPRDVDVHRALAYAVDEC